MRRSGGVEEGGPSWIALKTAPGRHLRASSRSAGGDRRRGSARRARASGCGKLTRRLIVDPITPSASRRSWSRSIASRTPGRSSWVIYDAGSSSSTIGQRISCSRGSRALRKRGGDVRLALPRWRAPGRTRRAKPTPRARDRELFNEPRLAQCRHGKGSSTSCRRRSPIRTTTICGAVCARRRIRATARRSRSPHRAGAKVVGACATTPSTPTRRWSGCSPTSRNKGWCGSAEKRAAVSVARAEQLAYRAARLRGRALGEAVATWRTCHARRHRRAALDALGNSSQGLVARSPAAC